MSNKDIGIYFLGVLLIAAIIGSAYHGYSNPVSITYVGIVSDVDKDRIVIDGIVVPADGILQHHWEIGKIHKVDIKECYYFLFMKTERRIINVEIVLVRK